MKGGYNFKIVPRCHTKFNVCKNINQKNEPNKLELNF